MDVQELADLLSDTPRQAVRAVPGTGTKVPLWILGSSLFGAQLAAHLGLPYAFASHFAPAQLMQLSLIHICFVMRRAWIVPRARPVCSVRATTVILWKPMARGLDTMAMADSG